jgi:hypothetical protein
MDADVLEAIFDPEWKKDSVAVVRKVGGCWAVIWNNKADQATTYCVRRRYRNKRLLWRRVKEDRGLYVE